MPEPLPEPVPKPAAEPPPSRTRRGAPTRGARTWTPRLGRALLSPTAPDDPPAVSSACAPSATSAQSPDQPSPTSSLEPTGATAGRLAITAVAISALVALVWWLLPTPVVLAPLWTQVVGWPAALLGRSVPVQRRLGGGRLDNRVWARVAIGGTVFAAVLAPTGMAFLFPLYATLVISVHLQWTGPSAWRAGATLTVLLTLLLQAGTSLDLVPTLLSGSAGLMATGTALVASLATTANIALLAKQRETGTAALDAQRRVHHDQLLHAANHDPLTGLLNRTGLNAAYASCQDAHRADHRADRQTDDHTDHQIVGSEPSDPAEVDPAPERAERPARGVGLLYLDLDGFKSVNDAHGHRAGDRLLCLVSERLTALLRPSDHLARVGGDEFIVLLSTSDPAEVASIAERAAAAVRARFDLGDAVVAISASIGSVTVQDADAGDSTLDDLMNQADTLMYEAKAARR